jgi:GNAT superfamily N-acetyltransferase
MYYINDSNPNSTSSHTLEVRKGFDVCAKLIIEEKNDEWLVESLYTKPQYRGEGLGRTLVSYVEDNYGDVVISSEADGFWKSAGYKECQDGLWRKDNE